MRSQFYDFQLVGRSPLLLHADDIEKADELMAWRKDPANKKNSAAGDDRSPAWTWQTYAYSDGENIVLPEENVMACLRKAAADLTLKRQKSFKELSQSGMMIDGEYCEFYVTDGVDDDGKPVKPRQLPMKALHGVREKKFAEQAEWAKKNGFQLWMKRARVGTAKHIRVRPRFDHWCVMGRMEVMAQEITEEILRSMFQLAGRVGIGDWRPGGKTPGRYGMFDAYVKASE